MSHYMASIINRVSRSPLFAFNSIRKQYDFEKIMTALEIFCKTLRYYETKSNTGFRETEWNIFLESHHHRDTSKVLTDEGLTYATIASFIQKFLIRDTNLFRCEFIKNVKPRNKNPSDWWIKLQKLLVQVETEDENSDVEPNSGFQTPQEDEDGNNTILNDNTIINGLSYDDGEFGHTHTDKESTKINIDPGKHILPKKLQFSGIKTVKGSIRHSKQRLEEKNSNNSSRARQSTKGSSNPVKNNKHRSKNYSSSESEDDSCKQRANKKKTHKKYPVSESESDENSYKERSTLLKSWKSRRSRKESSDDYSTASW